MVLTNYPVKQANSDYRAKRPEHIPEQKVSIIEEMDAWDRDALVHTGRRSRAWTPKNPCEGKLAEAEKRFCRRMPVLGMRMRELCW